MTKYEIHGQDTQDALEELFGLEGGYVKGEDLDLPGYRIYHSGHILDIQEKKVLKVYNNGTCRVRNNRGAKTNINAGRLIATAFIPNPKYHSFLNFLDGDKMNFDVLNMEWVRSQNKISDRTIQALDYHAEGHSIVQIAHMLNTKPQIVRSILKRHANLMA